MPVFWFFVQMILTYVVFGNVAALFLLWVLRKRSIDRLGVLFTGLGLAPGIVALILYVSFILFPHQSRFLYIGVVSAAFLVLAAFSRRGLALLVETYRALFRRRPHSTGSRFVLWFAVFVISISGLVVFYTASFFPIQTYDALQHAYIGRMLSQDRSLEHFPLRAPLPDSFEENVRYPPGLHLLYAWSYLVQGSTYPDWGARIVAPLFFLLTLLLLWRWGEEIATGVGLFAALALATVPAYVEQVSVNSIDGIRLFFFLAAFYWLFTLLSHRTRWVLTVTVLAIVIGCFIHTIGLLVLPVAGLVWLFMTKGERLWKRFLYAGALVSCAGTLSLVDYARKWIVSGSWSGPTLYFPYDWKELLGERGLGSARNVFVSGILQFLTDPRLYGIMGWLSVCALLLLAYRRHRENRAFVFVSLCAALSFVLIAASPLQPPGWANFRYMMTVLPLLALCAGLFLLTVERRLPDVSAFLVAHRKPVFVCSIIVAGVAIAGSIFVTPSFVGAHFSPDGILEPGTVHRIQFARVVLGVLAAAFALGGTLVLRPRRRHVLIGLGALVLGLAAGAVLLSPTFVAAHLSADHQLEPGTVHRIQFARVFLGILAAGGLSLLLGPTRLLRKWRDSLAQLPEGGLQVLPMAFLLFVSWAPALGGLMWTKTVTPSTVFQPHIALESDEQKLLSTKMGNLTSALYLSRATPEGSRVLVTEFAPFPYYGKRPAIAWDDLRMKPFYKASSVHAAYDVLVSMGITYLQISERTKSRALYRDSFLGPILADPALTRLIWESGGNYLTQIYELRK